MRSQPSVRVTISEYLVELKIFHGPLDLLLYLVRRNEVEVARIQLGKIARDFMQYLDVLQLLDLDLTGEFLVMASTLLEIKSREALPQQEEEQPEEEESVELDSTRSELVQRLLEYKKYKDAALALEDQAAQWHQRYPRLSDDRPRRSHDPSEDRIKGVELWDLVSALSRVLQTKDVTPQSKMERDETPIGVYQERIRARIKVEGKVTFSSLFENTNLRSRITGIFLALLELVRHHHFRAEQPADFGEIWILPPAEESAA